MSRIAMVVPGGVDRSGERRVIPALLALIRRLATRHDLHVFALEQEPEPARWELLGAHVHNIGRSMTRVRAVRAIASEHQRAPFDVIQSVWSGSPGLVAVAAARLARVPCVIHVAGGELVALTDIGYGGELRWRGRLRERVVLGHAQAVSAASEPVIASLRERGVAAERIPLGVDLERWPARPPVRRAPDEPLRLLHLASLNRVKDPQLLLRCARRLLEHGVRFSLDVVGEDTLKGEIQRRADEMSLSDRVRFHGFLTQAELRPVVERAHLLVLTSRHEAGPLAVLEAAVAGVPTVGTMVGHVAEWAPEAALGVPVGDDVALAAAIERLSNDEPRRLALATEAMARATREDAAFTAARFESLYERVCASQRMR